MSTVVFQNSHLTLLVNYFALIGCSFFFSFFRFSFPCLWSNYSAAIMFRIVKQGYRNPHPMCNSNTRSSQGFKFLLYSQSKSTQKCEGNFQWRFKRLLFCHLTKSMISIYGKLNFIKFQTYSLLEIFMTMKSQLVRCPGFYIYCK